MSLMRLPRLQASNCAKAIIANTEKVMELTIAVSCRQVFMGLVIIIHSENSHVIPALIRKIHDAKANQLPEVVVWGSGRPRREFVYIDDMSAAIIHVMNLDLAQYREHTEDMVSHINIGFGDDVAIKELAKQLVKIVGYEGKLIFDLNKPDGVLRKLMDSSLIESLGWRATVSLEDGLTLTYADYLKNKSLLRSD